MPSLFPTLYSVSPPGAITNNELKGIRIVKESKDATSFFSTEAARWTALYEKKAEFRDRLELFTEGVKKVTPPPARVLDYGCGSGVISLALGRSGYEVLGLDGAEEMVSVARQNQQIQNVGNVRFELTSSPQINLNPNSFDIVICSSVIEYIENDTALVEQLVSVLKPGGYLFISIPHSQSLLGRVEDWLKRNNWYNNRCGRGFLKFSLRRYEPESFLKVLKKFGLGKFKVTYFEAPLGGRYGVLLSRWHMIGMMLLVVARKNKDDI